MRNNLNMLYEFLALKLKTNKLWSFSLYIFTSSQEDRAIKSYGALKIRKMTCSKKVTLSKKIHIFFVLFLFLLKDNSYSFLFLKFQVAKLKIAIEVIKLLIWPKSAYLKKKKITSLEQGIFWIFRAP